jgi:hypothetical protein
VNQTERRDFLRKNGWVQNGEVGEKELWKKTKDWPYRREWMSLGDAVALQREWAGMFSWMHKSKPGEPEGKT